MIHSYFMLATFIPYYLNLTKEEIVRYGRLRLSKYELWWNLYIFLCIYVYKYACRNNLFIYGKINERDFSCKITLSDVEIFFCFQEVIFPISLYKNIDYI